MRLTRRWFQENLITSDSYFNLIFRSDRYADKLLRVKCNMYKIFVGVVRLSDITKNILITEQFRPACLYK